MQTFMPVEADFNTINRYITDNNIKLLIIDFNGVLDDYYERKADFLRDVLGSENKHHLPELLLAIERAYLLDRTATIEQTCEQFFASMDTPLTELQRNRLANNMFASQLTDRSRVFLDSLEVPFVIYTALSDEQVRRVEGLEKYQLFTRDQYQEAKPSIANLKFIMRHCSVDPAEVCVVGDGLIDDLMPASLIGAHTILVSPYVNLLACSNVT